MRPSVGLITTSALAIAVGITGAGRIDAQPKQEYMPKVETRKLLETSLRGVEGKKVTMMHFKLPPGYVGDQHYHTGPVFVYVEKGALTIEQPGKAQRTIPVGQVYVEPINEPMLGRNLSTNEAAELVVFQIHGEGEPLMYKTD